MKCKLCNIEYYWTSFSMKINYTKPCRYSTIFYAFWDKIAQFFSLYVAVVDGSFKKFQRNCLKSPKITTDTLITPVIYP